MILYFSGTGNSAYVAKYIGKNINDEVLNIFSLLKNKDFSTVTSEKPFVVVLPTYAWQIPHLVRDWMKKTQFEGSKEIYFVMTCGSDIGNGGYYAKKLSEKMGMTYRGTAQIIMPENYIAMYKAPETEEAKTIVNAAKPSIDAAVKCINDNQEIPKVSYKFGDYTKSSWVNVLFNLLISGDKFYSLDSCNSCGYCEKSCPTNNIKIVEGKPVWEKDCTHCMACICTCPQAAIEYGNTSKGKPRYTCPKMDWKFVKHDLQS